MQKIFCDMMYNNGMYSHHRYNEDYSLQTNLSLSLSFICLIIQSIMKCRKKDYSELKVLIKEIITYILFMLFFFVFIKLTTTDISLLSIAIIIILVNTEMSYDNQLIFLFASILIQFVLYIYEEPDNYRIFRLIQIEDIIEETIPKLFISMCLFSIICTLMPKISLLIQSIIKFSMFISIITYFIISINITETIKTIFPSYTFIFIFLLTMLTYVYLEITCSFDVIKIDTQENDELMVISFYKRNKIDLGTIGTNREKIINILTELQKMEIYASITNIEEKTNIIINMFPEVTIENLDKIIKYIEEKDKKGKPMSTDIFSNLKNLRESYEKNWINIVYDAFDKLVYTTYKQLIALSLDDKKHLNNTLAAICAIIISAIIYLIFQDMIVGIAVFLFLINCIYTSFIKHKFLNNAIEIPTT